MTRSLLFFLCFLGNYPALQSQVFWTESFNNEGEASTEWLNGGTNPGLAHWTWTENPGAGFQDPDLPGFASPTATKGYFYFDADNNGQVPFDVTLTGTGAPADCSGKSDVRLRFFTQYIYFNPSGTVAQVGVSTDGVYFTYHDLFEGLPANLPYHDWVEIDLDEADNQPQVWLQFRWTGNYEYHWKIDDLQLFRACDQVAGAILCDNFDTYDPAQKLGLQADHWTTWSGQEGGVEDGVLADEVAHSVPYALKIEGPDSSGDLQRVLLDLGGFSSGRYALQWSMFVAGGRAAYYDIQDLVPPGSGNWGLRTFFSETGTGEVQQGESGPVVGTFSFPAGQWFEVRHVIDLDNNLISLYIDGQFVLKRLYLKNLGGIHFSGLDTSHLFYVDDLAFAALPPVVYTADFCDGAVDISAYLGQAPNVAQTTGLFDNTMATVSPDDPLVSCWNENGSGGLDILNTTLWFTFTGDGGTYAIQTVPCNAANYIGVAQGSPGDTQMLVFEGENCSALTPVQCNDDLYPTGIPDWRAGVTLETDPGQSYYMLIDGFDKQGVVATGAFCIQVTRKQSVACSEGQVGAFSFMNSGFLCAGGNLSDVLKLDTSSFVLPTEGPQYGLAWCFSPDSIPAGVWPGGLPNIASTPFSPDLKLPALVNNNVSLNYGVYYLTPVVLGGGTLINPGALPYVFNIDPANGCYFTGKSLKLTLLPPLPPLTANFQTIAETIPPGSNGAVVLTVGGGSGAVLNDPDLYQYQWSNGASTRNISGLATGTYTVTISDRSGCTGALVRQAIVNQTLGTETSALVQGFDLYPNPVRNAVTLTARFAEAVDIRIELLDMPGRVIKTLTPGKTDALRLRFELGDLPGGLYLLRLDAGAETHYRRVLVQR